MLRVASSKYGGEGERHQAPLGVRRKALKNKSKEQRAGSKDNSK